MKLMSEGDFALQTAAFPRAERLLTDAVKQFRDGADVLKSTDGLPPVMIGNPADSSFAMQFLDWTEALRCNAVSDGALFRGDLAAAAAAEGKRAEALGRSQAMHARLAVQSPSLIPGLHESFTRRLERDKFIATSRQDKFSDALGKLPGYQWAKALMFFILAVLPLAVAVPYLGKYGRLDNPAKVGLLLLYTFVIAGVGSQLVSWGGGKDAMLQALSGQQPEKAKV